MTKARIPASVLALLASGVLAGLPIFADAAIDAARARQESLLESSQTILNTAEAETRDLTTAEQTEVDGLTREFEDLENQIGLRQRVLNQAANLNAPRGRQTEPEPTADDLDEQPRNAGRQPAGRQSPVYPSPRATARGNFGFRSMGDFAFSVRNASLGRETDPRLRNAAASTYSSEGTGADGGFLVPPDFSTEIAAKVFSEDSLIGRTDRLQTSSNSLTVPTDETTPWDSSGGIQAYWGAEAGTMNQSKVRLGEAQFKMHKLHVLVPVTEEQIEDAPATDSYLRKKVPTKMDFKLSTAILRGSGAGQPLGVLNSTALVTVAAEAGQTADTVVAANVLKMYSRMPAASRPTAVWLINPDAEWQLPLMTIGNQPIYIPPGGLSASPYGLLLGRPVIPHQLCSTLGDVGDIMFVDFEQYMTLTKIGGGRDASGMKSDVSMHLWFDQDLTAYKFTVRVGGQPWQSAPTDPLYGTNKLSPFVTLAAR